MKTKYPCEDGINRDEHIDQCIKLKAEIATKSKEAKRLRAKVRMMENELFRISVDWLGAFGEEALAKAERDQG